MSRDGSDADYMRETFGDMGDGEFDWGRYRDINDYSNRSQPAPKGTYLGWIYKQASLVRFEPCQGMVHIGKESTCNSEAIQLAKKLILLKEKEIKLKEEERNIKYKLFKHLKNKEFIGIEAEGDIKMHYIIERSLTRQAPRLDPSATLKFIYKKYGAPAVELLKKHCYVNRNSSESIYIRPFKRKQ